MSSRYEKALLKARKTGDVAEFIDVAEKENLKRYKDPIVRETARRLRNEERIGEKETKDVWL